MNPSTSTSSILKRKSQLEHLPRKKQKTNEATGGLHGARKVTFQVPLSPKGSTILREEVQVIAEKQVLTQKLLIAIFDILKPLAMNIELAQKSTMLNGRQAEMNGRQLEINTKVLEGIATLAVETLKTITEKKIQDQSDEAVAHMYM